MRIVLVIVDHTTHLSSDFFRHFAFISFVNDNAALEVLRQHGTAPITFQNRLVILAPAYKKNNLPPSFSECSFNA